MPADMIIQLSVLFFCIIIHEFSHGWMANRCGDNTAKSMGRLTLNPLPHIDPMGTIIFPVLCYLSNNPIFGWAKPVPVNPFRLNNPRWDSLKVALLGPVSNLLLACLAAWGIRSLGYFSLAPGWIEEVWRILNFAVIINLYLSAFNLLPIHPLDGSRVLSALLPDELSKSYEQLAPFGFYAILALSITGILGRLTYPVVFWMYRILIP